MIVGCGAIGPYWDKEDESSFFTIFVLPEYQGKGIESAIMAHIFENYVRAGRSPYKTFELAWIGDFNPVMNRMVERYICAHKNKVHTTYRYLFDRTKEFTRCPRVGFKPRPKAEEAPAQENKTVETNV